MSRDCDAIACTTPVAPGRFMCIRHWRMVPLDLQRAINTRYRACRKDFGFLSDVACAHGVPDTGQCPACGGYGRVNDGSGARSPYGPKCPTCGGSGRVPAGVEGGGDA